MGRMVSKIEKIDKLCFHPYNSRVVNGKTVKIGGIMTTLSDKGMIYTDSPLAKHACFCVSDWWWMKDVFESLKRLGVLTKGEIDEHLEYVQEVIDRRSKLEVISTIRQINNKYGLKLKLPKKFNPLHSYTRNKKPTTPNS